MKHYIILKQVICDLIDSYCTEQMPYKSSITPNCKNCDDYNMFIFREKVCSKCNNSSCIKTVTEIRNCEFYEN